MKASDLEYELPERLIARHPADRREESRLLRVPRATAAPFTHHRFRDLPGMLREGDLLVLNDTRVLPARLLGRRLPDGGKVEVLLVERIDERRWNALVRPGKKIREGDRIVFAADRLAAQVLSFGERGSGERILEFAWTGDWQTLLAEIGHTPLPPYILKARKHDLQTRKPDAFPEPEDPDDRERYQTVYAAPPAEAASVAAPTAGLHFTPALLEALQSSGVERVFVRLEVGPGTFKPIETEDIQQHHIHAEHFCITDDAARTIREARRAGRRIVAVGTTVVRTLETVALVTAGEGAGLFDGEVPAAGAQPGEVAAARGCTTLMIAPGFRFRVTDALLTNFHLPRSTLLLLVGAFAGMERIRVAYAEAVRAEYRFYSYGDCMLLE